MLTEPLEVDGRVARRVLTSPACSLLFVGVAVPDILKSEIEKRKEDESGGGARGNRQLGVFVCHT